MPLLSRIFWTADFKANSQVGQTLTSSVSVTRCVVSWQVPSLLRLLEDQQRSVLVTCVQPQREYSVRDLVHMLGGLSQGCGDGDGLAAITHYMHVDVS